MIRIRRCAPRGLLRRPRYEVEQLDSSGMVIKQQETTTPATVIDQYVGIAEAWALIHAADKLWARASDEWSSLPPL